MTTIPPWQDWHQDVYWDAFDHDDIYSAEAYKKWIASLNKRQLVYHYQRQLARDVAKSKSSRYNSRKRY